MAPIGSDSRAICIPLGKIFIRADYWLFKGSGGFVSEGEFNPPDLQKDRRYGADLLPLAERVR